MSIKTITLTQDTEKGFSLYFGNASLIEALGMVEMAAHSIRFDITQELTKASNAEKRNRAKDSD